MSKGNSEWDKVCQVARWGLQISFCSLALLFELFKVCSGEMRTISMTICTVSYKEEAFFQAELLHYSAATATYVEKKKKKKTQQVWITKTLILLTSSCLEQKMQHYKSPVMSLGYFFFSSLGTSGYLLISIQAQENLLQDVWIPDSHLTTPCLSFPIFQMGQRCFYLKKNNNNL